jgi:hypothetical protein
MTTTPLPTPCGEKTFPDPNALVTIAEGIKARVIELYEQAHDYDPSIALPARRYWQTGQPAYDCEQMVVWLESLQEGLIGDVAAPQHPCDVFITATFKVAVVRCIAVGDDNGTPPLPAAIEATAKPLAQDAYLLMKASCRFDMYGADVEGAPLGGMGVDANLEFEEPSGGMAAVVLTVTTVLG